MDDGCVRVTGTGLRPQVMCRLNEWVARRTFVADALPLACVDGVHMGASSYGVAVSCDRLRSIG